MRRNQKKDNENFQVFGRDDINARQGIDNTSSPATSNGGYPLKKYRGKYAMELTIEEEKDKLHAKRLSNISNRHESSLAKMGIQKK